MIMKLLTVLLVVASTPCASAVNFIFEEELYSFTETFGQDNVKSIVIRRVDATAEELDQLQEISLIASCPHGVNPTASTADYTVGSSVIFDVGEVKKEVEVTVKNDDIDELTELFCLTIDIGNKSAAVIEIPGNDFCYLDFGKKSFGATVSEADFIGPWDPRDTRLDVEVTVSDGRSYEVYLSNSHKAISSRPEQDNYRLLFEANDGKARTPDADGNPGGGTDGDSILFRNTHSYTTYLDTIAPASEDLIRDDQPSKFWIKYDKSTGTISVGLPDDLDVPIWSYVDGANNAIDVRYIYHASFFSEASVKACIVETNGFPLRQIQPVNATSSGYRYQGIPSGAIDNRRKGDLYDMYTSYCFISDVTPNQWLRLDMGQVYEVWNVLVYLQGPADFDADLVNTVFDNTDILVGSCPTFDSPGNRLCLNTGDYITTFMGSIGGLYPYASDSCDPGTYGRYLFFTKSTGVFYACEVHIYGREVSRLLQARLQFSQSHFEVDENDGSIMIATNRTGLTESCTSAVYYTESMTATSNDFVPVQHFGESTSEISFSPGENVATIDQFPITILDDNLCEPSETFRVILTDVKGGVTGVQTSAIVTINDDDGVTFSLEYDRYEVNEGDGDINIGIQRTGKGVMQPGSAELVFADNTATSPDYNNARQVVDFETSNSDDTEYGSVTLQDDYVYEEDEIFQVSLGTLTPSNGCSARGEIPTASVIIQDNDSRFWFKGDTAIFIPEGESRTVEINRLGTEQMKELDIVVNGITADATADVNIVPAPSDDVSSVTFLRSDDSESITISTVNDFEVESDEVFTLTLRDPRYPEGNRADPYTITVIIVDNDGRYSWKQREYFVEEQQRRLPVCLTRTGSVNTMAEEKVVGITSNRDTADPGSDFKPLSTIVFTPGSAEACEYVQILEDTEVESSESFKLSINAGQDIVIGPDNIATITITDDDTEVGWAQDAYTFEEGATNSNVLINKRGDGPASIRLVVTPGSATEEVDFEIDALSVTIPLGLTSQIVPIIINDDKEVESDETFTLILTRDDNGAISPQAQAIITIADDDTDTDTGLGGGAIAAIIVPLIIGVLIVLIAVMVFRYCVSGRANAPVTTSVPATGLIGNTGLFTQEYGYNPSGFGLQNPSFYNPYA